MVPVFARASAATYLLGQKQARQSAVEARKEMLRKNPFSFGLSLALYDAEIKELQEDLGLSDAEIKHIINTFGDQTTQILEAALSGIDKHLTPVVQKGIIDGLTRGQIKTKLTTAMSARGLGPTKDYQLDTLFRTQVNAAYNAGQWDATHDPDIDEILWGYEYATVGDERVRDSHAALDGTKLPKDHSLWQSIWPPNGFNCFIPDTYVTGNALLGIKSWYVGDIFEIETAMGVTLSVTANHPIATGRGWTVAQALQEGDTVFSNRSIIELIRLIGSPQDTTGTVNENDRPARIDNVFNTLSANGSASIEVSPLEFNGDAQFFNGKVDIVGTNIELVHKISEAYIHKMESHCPFPIPDETLIIKNSFSLFNKLALRSSGSSLGSPGRGALPSDIPIGFSQPFEFLRIGPASSLDAFAGEETHNSDSAYAKFLSELLGCRSFLVQSDKVIRVVRRKYSGHVYDLQTNNHIIVANGLITSNCRCTIIEVFEREPIKLPKEGGQPDPGFNFNPGVVLSPLGAGIPSVDFFS